jgi:hypothetical protein
METSCHTYSARQYLTGLSILAISCIGLWSPPIVFAVHIPTANTTPGVSSGGRSGVSTSTREWEHKRQASLRRFGSEVYSRAPLADEDTLKVFLYRNNKLYEDKNWRAIDASEEYFDVEYSAASKKKGAEERVWGIMSEIATPAFLKKNVSHYVTYRDDTDGRLAMVWRGLAPKEPSWYVGVNMNAADFSNQKWLRDVTITLVHEYAHLVALNKTQMKYRRTTETGRKVSTKPFCLKGYINSLGCATETSYQAMFVEKFWGKPEMNMLLESRDAKNDDEAAEIVEEFYESHMQDFTTVYAANNPEEDFAESFTDFILRTKPTSTTRIRDAKILFFYNYPELVRERTRIRSAIRPYILP